MHDLLGWDYVYYKGSTLGMWDGVYRVRTAYDGSPFIKTSSYVNTRIYIKSRDAHFTFITCKPDKYGV